MREVKPTRLPPEQSARIGNRVPEPQEEPAES